MFSQPPRAVVRRYWVSSADPQHPGYGRGSGVFAPYSRYDAGDNTVTSVPAYTAPLRADCSL